MLQSQKLKAAELAIALAWGFAELSEAVAWADEQIINTDEPHHALLDLSMSTGPNEAAGYLRELSKGTDKWINLACFLSRFEKATTIEPQTASKLARHLYMLTQYDDPPKGFTVLSSHWDRIDLSRDGIYGDTEACVRDFLNDIRNVVQANGGAGFETQLG